MYFCAHWHAIQFVHTAACGLNSQYTCMNSRKEALNKEDETQLFIAEPTVYSKDMHALKYLAIIP